MTAANTTTPVVDAAVTSAILRVLDAALGARLNLDRLVADVPGADEDHADVAVTFMAQRFPQAEYALRLWASANNLEVRDEEFMHHLSYGGDRRASIIRTVVVDYKGSRIAWVQWPAAEVTP